ncbi:MAG: bactofilin family protein [Longimicrobiales bacterium]
MARDRGGNGAPPESVISIIGPGMRVVGDCETDGTIRIEGMVEGSVRAGKAVVVGKDGVVSGDIATQDAVISGTVNGTVVADSRLEIQATSRIEGDVRARRLQLEEGAIFNGTVHMGESTGRSGAPTLDEGLSNE